MSAILEVLNINSSRSLTCRSYQDQTFFCPFHLHPEYELVFIERGYVEASVGNQQHLLVQGELQLVGANVPHSFKLGGESQTVLWSKYMHIEPILFNALGGLAEFHLIARLIQRFEQGAVFELDDVMREEYLNVFQQQGAKRVLALMAFFLGLMDQQPIRFASANYLPSERSNKVMSKVMAAAKLDLTLAQMASQLNMSISTLNRILKKGLGMSYVEFVNHTRVNIACDLLREGQVTITDIALEVGFKSSSQFNKVFKQNMKLSPRVYRDSYQELVPIELDHDELTWDVGEHC